VNDGAVGEGDDIQSIVERAVGGTKADTMLGKDDGPKGDTLNCQTGRGKAFSGPNDTVQNCD
jgi:hypothetical protein